MLWAYARMSSDPRLVETFRTEVPINFFQRIEHQNSGELPLFPVGAGCCCCGLPWQRCCWR